MKTTLQFKGLSFSLMSFPFSVTPDGRLRCTPDTTFTSLKIHAVPAVETCEDWQTEVLAGQTLRFKGKKAGTADEIIEMDMKAEKASHPKDHLIISFTPVVATNA